MNLPERGTPMKKIHRSQENRKIAGLCGGLSEIYSIDPTLLRLAFVFGGLATGILPLLATYIIGWIIVPTGSSQQEKSHES